MVQLDPNSYLCRVKLLNELKPLNKHSMGRPKFLTVRGQHGKHDQPNLAKSGDRVALGLVC
jgi:hypothetical protein